MHMPLGNHFFYVFSVNILCGNWGEIVSSRLQ
uniref:Uncharacterized protein n=1 Tax=Anguilla anguilla TaxID=7936 RepID=A0A0E9SMD6_ANGAN